MATGLDSGWGRPLSAQPTGFRLSGDLVRQITGCAVARVILMPEGQPCFLADVPAAGSDTPLADVLEQVALFESRPIIINDLRENPRFADHPAVVEEPNFVFWVAFPLITDEGFLLGAICALDHRPRKLTVEQTSLARRIASELARSLKQQRNRRERWAEQMERMLLSMQSVAYVEDIATAVSFLRFCSGRPAAQREAILLPAAGLADFDESGELVLTDLGLRLMEENELPARPAFTKARAVMAEDVLLDMLSMFHEPDEV